MSGIKTPARNKKWLVLLVAAILIFLLYSVKKTMELNTSINELHTGSLPSFVNRSGALWSVDQKQTQIGYSNYLIDTPGCQIPNVDPFADDIKKFIQKESYTKCTDLELLTYIEKESGIVTLNVNTSLAYQYSWFPLRCCYSEIHRVDGYDDRISYTTCEYFREAVEIRHPFIKVECKNWFQKLYENVHATALSDNVQYNSTGLNNNSDTSFSVLLVAIDSMSKQNLRRTMPNSYKYLEDYFINLRGYIKIADNTYPNLMAILTGQNTDQLWESCPFCITNKRNKLKNPLSSCNLIWKQFSSFGYKTAYAEDACRLSTFNYAKIGFSDAPTDYYYRPYFLAAEKLKSKSSKCHNRFCSGPETTGERLLNTAKDFFVNIRDRPRFGLFWTNSFSHDNHNCPSAMDDKLLEFLSDHSFLRALKDTVFIFFSDHGFRFGDIRRTNTGWFEERLPFIYLRLPLGFQKRFPKEYKNVVLNSHRLTSPYDVYNTLQHILKLSNSSYEPGLSLGCDSCQSLFKEVSYNRTCEEAGISQRWCTCISYRDLPTTNASVRYLGLLVVRKVNKLVQNFTEGNKCMTYSFRSVHSAGISETRKNKDNKPVNYILLMVNAEPAAMFEATLEVTKDLEDVKVVDDINRLDSYESNSYCVSNSDLKMYCHCG
ncbi:hypothetical protein NQ315_009234 [Exocentrus adspersus]|uniref:Uncharacterized protein n=1 Tax=Exocentrus adspersus TaxID=1586481 RepID=A0AAV8WGP5_9CUCU|nr:hypothetical protein NQ315_009234 [Exocentrus adspersus]